MQLIHKRIFESCRVWVHTESLNANSFFTPSSLFPASSLLLLSLSPSHCIPRSLLPFLSSSSQTEFRVCGPQSVYDSHAYEWLMNDYRFKFTQMYARLTPPPPSPCHPPFSTWHPHKWNAIKTRKRKMKKKTFDAKSWKLIALPLSLFAL